MASPSGRQACVAQHQLKNLFGSSARGHLAGHLVRLHFQGFLDRQLFPFETTLYGRVEFRLRRGLRYQTCRVLRVTA